MSIQNQIAAAQAALGLSNTYTGADPTCGCGKKRSRPDIAPYVAAPAPTYVATTPVETFDSSPMLADGDPLHGEPLTAAVVQEPAIRPFTAAIQRQYNQQIASQVATRTPLMQATRIASSQLVARPGAPTEIY